MFTSGLREIIFASWIKLSRSTSLAVSTMALTSCRACGAAVPDGHACAACGASMAPAIPVAYRPPPPRLPEPPERTSWLTIAGWVAGAGLCVLIALFLFRMSGAVDLAATEAAEVEREEDHLVKVNSWMRDTSASATVPETAGRPVPTSDRAKRMWVISRMLVEAPLWEREVMKRHGARNRPPEAWGTSRYWANARSYPEVGTYVERRAAAIAEIEKTSAAWFDERVAALARESGLSPEEVRGIFPPGYGGAAADEAQRANTMLEIHRYLVRVDPRVHHAGGTELRYEREEDVRRFRELLGKLDAVGDQFLQARERRVQEEVAAFSRYFNGRVRMTTPRRG